MATFIVTILNSQNIPNVRIKFCILEIKITSMIEAICHGFLFGRIGQRRRIHGKIIDGNWDKGDKF